MGDIKEPITYACITQNRINSIKRNIPKVIDWVDKIVIVDGYSVDDTKEWLENYGSNKITVTQRRWDDSFANQYNEYLKFINKGWILLCDDDEIPSEALLRTLRPLIQMSEGGRKFNIVEYKSHPMEIDKSGNILYDNGPADYWRQIFFKHYPNMHYVIDLHQAIEMSERPKFIRRDEVYYHLKTNEDGYRNAVRNWWISGVWLPDAREGIKPPEWHEFRDVVRRVYPEVKVFGDLNAIMVKGNMHKSVKDYLWKIKDIEDEQPKRLFNELRSAYKYYFEKLWPNEKIEYENMHKV